jgi:hypothetical protein
MKPVKEGKLFPVLDKALAKMETTEPVLILNAGGEQILITQNMTFIVTPVYHPSGKGESLLTILLKLMKADTNRQ